MKVSFDCLVYVVMTLGLYGVIVVAWAIAAGIVLVAFAKIDLEQVLTTASWHTACYGLSGMLRDAFSRSLFSWMFPDSGEELPEAPELISSSGLHIGDSEQPSASRMSKDVMHAIVSFCAVTCASVLARVRP